ncbi:DUF7507 domain-containing protein [Arthrobacter alpinus]|uniref:DUF7507 domain-containing protein n=1 Tax=Arthrobacter alpinus TaxID=656366 RepID=UPI0009FAA83D|nr:VWA domain-containing protein [Arthrobacter alpinus]
MEFQGNSTKGARTVAPSKKKNGWARSAAATVMATAILTSGGISAATMATAAPSPDAAAVNPGACSMDLGVVLDSTYSFTQAEYDNTKQQAANFVTALGQGPGMNLSGSAFGYTAPLWGDGADFAHMSEANTKEENKSFYGTDISSSASATDASNRFLGFTREGYASSNTNWEAGLRSMQGKGLKKIVFITDGVPNAWGSTEADLGSIPGNVFINQQAMDGASRAIADLKAEGVEIIPLFIKTSEPRMHGINDPVSPSSTADIEKAMRLIDPNFTVSKALDVDQIAAKMLAEVTASCEPGLALDKSHSYDDTNKDGKPNAGDTLVYKFEVTNTGSTPLNTLELVDEKLSSMGITWAYPAGFSGTLAPGESVTATAAPYIITAADEWAGEIHNVATVTGKNPWNPDKNPPKQTDTDDQPVVSPPPAIDLVKSIKEVKDVNENGITDKGDTVVYGFKGTNTGTVPLTDVVLTDDMLSKVSPTSVAVTAQEDFKGTLAPGASTTWTSGEYTITQADVDLGLIHNTAVLDGIGVDKDKTPVKDTDEAKVNPDQKPAIDLEKTAHLNDTNNDGDADAGETIDYDFVATNTGNVTLASIELTDKMLDDAKIEIKAPEDFKATLAPGESVTFQAGSYTVTEKDASAGAVVNEATVTGKPPVGPDGKEKPPVTDTDEAKVPSVPNPTPVVPVVQAGSVATETGVNPALLIGGGTLGAAALALGGVALYRRSKSSAEELTDTK